MPEQGPRMNGFSLGELCWLFCCPPCPSRIAAKLAFLPPEPTYSVHTDPNGVTSLHLTERADWQYSQRELDAVEVLSTRSSRGNRVGCMFVRCAPNSRYTLLFSHGNAVDLGQMCSFYIGLGSRINCNVFSYDYSGYGVSTGKPSEKNLYADIEAAWQVLRNKWVLSHKMLIFKYIFFVCITPKCMCTLRLQILRSQLPSNVEKRATQPKKLISTLATIGLLEGDTFWMWYFDQVAWLPEVEMF